MTKERVQFATEQHGKRITKAAESATENADGGHMPRTQRGVRTRNALITAAAVEFGEKGFHEGSITGITQRAGVALGSFYTYFESKDAIFRALVASISGQVRDSVAPALAEGRDAIDTELAALKTFLAFAREHRELYRVIDEAEFIDPDGFRRHYEGAAGRILARLRKGVEEGSIRSDVGEIEAWAIMGMNVFLGLRFAVWGKSESVDTIASAANRLLAQGVADPKHPTAPPKK